MELKEYLMLKKKGLKFLSYPCAISFVLLLLFFPFCFWINLNTWLKIEGTLICLFLSFFIMYCLISEIMKKINTENYYKENKKDKETFEQMLDRRIKEEQQKNHSK